MARGRRPKPAEVKALLGNPGKRRLALLNQERPAPGADGATRIPEPPSYLTEDEREAYCFAYEALPYNLVRESDKVAVSEWAVWLVKFVNAKQRLEAKKETYESVSKHGSFLRINPDFLIMSRASDKMRELADRLGLNPMARSALTQKMLNAPMMSPPGELFSEPDGKDKKPASPAPLEDVDALGFLDDAGKQFSTH